MLSVLSLCHFLGIMFGGAAAGMFGDAFGLRATLTGGGALVVALCILYPALHRAVQREVEVSTTSATD